MKDANFPTGGKHADGRSISDYSAEAALGSITVLSVTDMMGAGPADQTGKPTQWTVQFGTVVPTTDGSGFGAVVFKKPFTSKVAMVLCQGQFGSFVKIWQIALDHFVFQSADSAQNFLCFIAIGT